ncbi:MAG TPA: hypothetical protein VMU24_05520 [Candidatus Acidoferrales bacterium]|nr:hypothetical protein [Candidatus Acidoferrales bacterium]
MMRVLPFAMVVALIASCAAQEDPLRRLQQIADSSNGGDCARYSIALALRLVEVGDRQYADGKVGEAEQIIRQTGHYAERGARCSLESHKHEKDTEINLRKLSKRLNEVERTLAFEDRPLVHEQAENIDRLREKLLTAMFGGKTADALRTKP